MLRYIFILAALIITPVCLSAGEFQSSWEQAPNRIWPGPDVWTNPMENWEVKDSKLICTNGSNDRNVHVLTHQLSNTPGAFSMSIDVSVVKSQGSGAVGFEIGIHDAINDFRGNVFWGKGIKAYITDGGNIVLGNKRKDFSIPESFDDLNLHLAAKPEGDKVELTFHVNQAESQIASITNTVPASQMTGNLALIHNPQAAFASQGKKPKFPRKTFAFKNWKISGEGIEEKPEQTFGPILWSMYSVSNSRTDAGHVMKLTALLPPLGKDDNKTVEMKVKTGDQWESLGTAEIRQDSFTATFEKSQWDASKTVPFQLVYQLANSNGAANEHIWTGSIRAEPLDRPLKLGGLTCQHYTGFPYAPVAENLKFLDPDVLFFSGDQIYENTGGYGIIREPAEPAIINYLRKFYLFGWAFGDVMRDRPTLCIPDDHDVFQGNIWGEGGMKMKPGGTTSSSGGYIEPIKMVEVVHATNTSHHPDFYDPTPIKQNMSVYYGDMVYGRVSFAILGDRQFKSAPGRVDTGEGKRPDHVVDPNVDVTSLDQPGLELLGERQETFLEDWVGDWRGADMKILLSETVFANAATHHGGKDGYLIADLDSGGWPQTPRNRAIKILRKGFSLHVNGDQHLTTLTQYGTDAQRDGCWSFCTPAISAGYPRWWRPDEIGRPYKNRPDHGLPNTGEYVDGFQNALYVYAVGNPEGTKGPDRYQTAHVKGSGFGLVHVDTKKRTYQIESYRFLADLKNSPKQAQFPGWPVSIKQMDNDGRQPVAWLPKLEVKGKALPAIQVINEKTGELEYALRLPGKSFQPHTFNKGQYTLRFQNDQGKWLKLTHLHSSSEKPIKTLTVTVK